MARRLIALMIFAGFLCASEKLEITADKIISNQSQTVISGNVVIKREQDVLYAKKVTVKMGKDKRPSKYEAIGDVKFFVRTNDGRKMRGGGDKIVYDASKDEYRLLKKAWVQEDGKPNAIRGEEIILNRKSGAASVVGGKKKPAKIIFTLEKQEEKKK